MNKTLQLVMVLILGLATSSFAQVNDGDFELGIGGGEWTEVSTNFGTPLCTETDCGNCGGDCNPRGGDTYVWIGGANAAETGSVEQAVTVPSGGDQDLILYLKIATPSTVSEDRLEISVDGTVLRTFTSADSTWYSFYNEVIIDIDAYADGMAHDIKIEGFQTTSEIVNFLVDDVRLSSDALNIFESKSDKIEVSVFPNPTADFINLEFGDLTGSASVIIRNSEGAEVAREKLSNISAKKFSFNTDAMSNGLYHVEVSTASGITSERVMVIR